MRASLGKCVARAGKHITRISINYMIADQIKSGSGQGTTLHDCPLPLGASGAGSQDYMNYD